MKDYPVTNAIRALRENAIPFVPHAYDYVEHGGTRRLAECRGVPEQIVIKTLVMETETKQPLIVLMHGNREVSTKRLARPLGVKQVKPCDPETAQRHTGYRVGGTSPFGLRKPLPVYAEAGIFALPKIVINGGRRGFLVEIAPQDIEKVIPVTRVEVAIGGPAE